MPPRIKNQTETPRDELQPEDTNPGNIKNAEPLDKAAKERKNQASDKGEAQSSEIDSPLAFVGHSKEAKQSPHGKTSDGDHCDAQYFSPGRRRILHENENARESQSGKIELKKRASLFLVNCTGLGTHNRHLHWRFETEYRMPDYISSILFVMARNIISS